MATSSKRVRKERRAKRLSRERNLKEQIASVMGKNLNLAQIAVEEHDKAKRLAKLLVFVVMKTGSRLAIPDAELAEVPDTAKLIEERDEQKGLTVLLSVAQREGGEESPIELVTPKIEVVR